MKILELVDSLRAGGAERMVATLGTGLAALGHQVTVVCLRESGVSADPLTAAGIEVIELKKPEGIHPGTLGRLAKLCAASQVDVIHTHNPLVHHYGVVAGLLARTPAVVNTMHGVDNIQSRFGKREIIFKFFCRMTDSVVILCRAAADRIADKRIVPQRKLVVIENGIPLDPLLAVTARRQREPFVFGILGRLVPVKDHAGLLQAFAEVVRRVAHARLEIAGDGPLRDALEAQARGLGIADSVSFLGHRPDVADVLASWNVLMLNSVSEGQPLSILEGMAAGLPIIGTDVGDIRNLVMGSKCGWLCRSGDPAALTAVMLEALSSTDLQEKGKRGRAFALEFHSVERMAREYEGLFNGILKRKQRHRIQRGGEVSLPAVDR